MKNTIPSYDLAIKQLSHSLIKTIRDPYLVSLSLLSHILRIPRTKILQDVHKHLTPNQYSELERVIQKLDSNYPISYIISNNNFYGLDFVVNDQVLIPRPETELLVDLILDHINGNTYTQPLKLLEIGTGTGCISISILVNAKQSLDIYAIDLSPSALNIAKQNKNIILSKEQARHLTFGVKDVLTDAFSEKFDIFFSNPPYISRDEYNQLDSSLFFEPKVALTDDYDGLTFYRKFVDIINFNLLPEGVCFFEIHSESAEKVLNIFNEGILRKFRSTVYKDIFGRDRVIKIKST